jgi:hypothetical protein
LRRSICFLNIVADVFGMVVVGVLMVVSVFLALVGVLLIMGGVFGFPGRHGGLSGRGFGGVNVVLGGVVLDAVAVVIVILVSGQVLGVEAIHDLADFEDGLGAIGFLGELQAAAVLGDDGGVDFGLAAACGEEERKSRKDASKSHAGHEGLGGLGGGAWEGRVALLRGRWRESSWVGRMVARSTAPLKRVLARGDPGRGRPGSHGALSDFCADSPRSAARPRNLT